METEWILLASVALLLRVLVLARRSRSLQLHAGGCCARLEEAIGRMERIHEGFARALAAQNGRNPEPKSGMSAEPYAARGNDYEAAALLLAAGQSAARVASLLGLPVEEVECVRELRRIGAQERKADAGRRVGGGRRRGAKAPSRRTRRPAKPILLTEVVASAAAAKECDPGLNGAAA
ncbi:MAG TPA: hypothetical protein VNN77_10465 [candidate division Zixibacteria bacterium]|nr:hypothetical protein [candidate division Zixibacteria bacterium]